MGRVAGTDNLVALVMGISTISAGYIIEENILSLRETLLLTGLIQISVGLIWLLFSSPKEKRFLNG